MPFINLFFFRVAEELNNSLGLTGSARKRPRLGTGPMQSGSPLGKKIHSLYTLLILCDIFYNNMADSIQKRTSTFHANVIPILLCKGLVIFNI